ncbi:hypothetical protein Dimus_026670 [Dionaea muscipula]
MNRGGGGQLMTSSSASDLIDAKLEEQQLGEGGSNHHCPSCGHKLDGKPDWVGLPAGVKFDPTDQELIEHLEAKAEVKSSKSHPLIDEFIPTIEGEDGICYTHPEKLPGVTRDGLSRHFFHRPSKAYTTGTRKRRKIQAECCSSSGSGSSDQGGETRWHKTGKTRPVMVNGKQKGCKKILVLYTNFGKNRKPEKTNWVMHQYHLGQHEEEKEGELVVSKIFYQTQPRQCNWSDRAGVPPPAAAAAAALVLLPSISSSNEKNINIAAVAAGTSNSKDAVMVIAQRDHDDPSLSAVGGGGGGASTTLASPPLPLPLPPPTAAMSSAYGAMDIQHPKAADHFSFLDPYGKSFDQAGMAEGSAVRSEAATMSSATCEEHDSQVGPHHHHHHHHHIAQELHHPHHHHHHQMTTAAFHISRPSNPISQIISPPLHHASINILDDDPFHVSRIMLQNETFHQLELHHQQQQQQQEQVQQQQQTEQEQHHKVVVVGGRAATGLEEIMMGCTTSSSTADIKQQATAAVATRNRQQEEEAEADDQWLKYSTFWHDPADNPDHHG